MEEVKQRILDFFVKYPSQVFKSRQLARRLHMTEEQSYQHLRKALHELVDDERIRRLKGKRYGYKQDDGQHKQGRLSVTRHGYGLVEVETGEEIFIAPSNLGTGIDGDLVRVVLYARPSRKHQQEGIELEGEVTDVIERSQREIVGVLKQTKNFYFVEPDSRRIPRDIYIPKAHIGKARNNDKVVAVIEDWDDPQLNPEGRVVKVLGASGDLNVELRSIAMQFDIPIGFPASVEKEAASFLGKLPKSEFKRRLDFRDTTVVTIDPEDAKDFDDALSLSYDDDGNYVVGVHIADVSYYVREGSVLDREAYKRGTSVYLVDGVIPMLPERLSNDLCSLRPDTDRPAYSVFMTVSNRGVVKDYSIRETVIRSARRFTYEEVQHIIENRKGEHADLILGLRKLMQTLLKKRMREGGIDFETSEVKFRLDESNKPIEVVKKERLDAHRLVEECMLLANRTVARHISSGSRSKGARGDAQKPFIYRVHAAPAREKLEELAIFVSKFGYSLNIDGGGLSKALQKLLSDVHGSDEENIINEVTLRSMMKAVYSEQNVGHFGLSFQHYTHFTSPIRRYPDLIVHRLLKEYEAGMTNERRLELASRMKTIGEYTSAMEQRAVEAERASVKIMQVEYMQRHIGDEFEGLVSGVVNYGIFVELSDILVEGMVHVRNMDDDYYEFDQRNYTLVGRRTGRKFRLGDTVRVKVLSVNPERAEIDFVLCDTEAE
jgi:ribonuclease R